MSAWVVLIAFAALLVLGWLAQSRRPVASELDDDDPQERDVGVIEIEDAIDLHGFVPKEIPAVVESYIEAAALRGFTEVRLIHGRGKGVQRRRVQSLLARHPLVEHFGDAPSYQGGWGATIARLRAKSPER